MVVHIGINFVDGQALTFDTTNEETMEIKFKADLNEKLVDLEDFKKIAAVFDLVCSHFYENIGCVCVCLNPNFNRYISMAIKYIGYKKGCQRVEIIDSYAARYHTVTSQAKFVSKNGHVIWIIDGGQCYVWHNVEGKLVFIQEFTGDFSKKEPIVKATKNMEVKVPNVLFYESHKNRNISTYLSLYSSMTSYNDEGFTKGALVKAQLLGKNVQGFSHHKFREDDFAEIRKNMNTLPFTIKQNSFEDASMKPLKEKNVRRRSITATILKKLSF